MTQCVRFSHIAVAVAVLSRFAVLLSTFTPMNFPLFSRRVDEFGHLVNAVPVGSGQGKKNKNSLIRGLVTYDRHAYHLSVECGSKYAERAAPKMQRTRIRENKLRTDWDC